MSILIKGMTMPTVRDTLVLIRTNGAAIVYEDNAYMTTAVPVPLHGRLIDADTFNVIAYQGIPDGRENTFDDGVEWLVNRIDTAPTIIEAEGEVMHDEIHTKTAPADR